LIFRSALITLLAGLVLPTLLLLAALTELILPALLLITLLTTLVLLVVLIWITHSCFPRL